MADTSPPNQHAFYEQVWSLVRQAPRGKVVTYGQIAQLLPPPAEMNLETYQALSPRSVSYTHLDVYKRQIQNSLRVVTPVRLSQIDVQTV